MTFNRVQPEQAGGEPTAAPAPPAPARPHAARLPAWARTLPDQPPAGLLPPAAAPLLPVSRPGDAVEQVAKQAAEQALAPAPTPDHPRAAPAAQPASGGQPLDPAARAELEPRFGIDFSHVRIHTDSWAAASARAMAARAYTVGQEIVFGAGQYAPGTHAGRRLIAHELAHVVQQRQGRPALMRDVDEKYYSDRAGAVKRARELQQTHTRIEVFERSDKNWQVRYDDPVPAISSFPAEDAGHYYPDRAGAEGRALVLRAYGFSVEVFQRPDGNWQCRITRLSAGGPGLPTALGHDPGLYFTLQESANNRAEALQRVGYSTEVFQRTDSNWQVKITALPTFDKSKGTSAAPTPTPAPTPAPKPAPSPAPAPTPTPAAPTPTPAAPTPTPAAPTPTPAAPAAPGGAATTAGALPHKLVVINTADPAKKKLSDAVAQSYRDFAAEIKKLTGDDLDLNFGDTVRDLGSVPGKAGADTVSWHKTGRAVDINQGLKWVIQEAPSGGETYFRLYLRHSDKSAAAKAPEIVKFAKGATFHHTAYTAAVLESWPFVDVTAIAAKHGWMPIPAQAGWEKSYNKREWWHFEKREGQTWYQSLAQIYSEADIVAGIKTFAGAAAGANAYGGRLKREGVPESILIKASVAVTQGAVTLRMPVGTGKKAANLTDDVKAVQEALIKAGNLTGTATGVMNAATEKAILDFQTVVKDGLVEVGGATHKALGKVK